MWKRRRRYRDKSMRYAPQPFDNERQYYSGFASGKPYVKSTWQVDDFMMPYSYRPPKPPTWSPNRKYPNPYKPKPQLKKYDDTVPEPIKEPVPKPVQRDSLVPPLVLYEPAYERHLAAFNKSARLTSKYSKMLDDKRYSKKMHNALYKALEREHNRREMIVSAPPLPKRKQLPPLQGRTIEEFYAPIEDKEHARLITYREGDTMTVAKAIDDERRENMQPRQVEWIDNDVLENRVVEHQSRRDINRVNRLNDRRNQQYQEQQLANYKEQRALARADDVRDNQSRILKSHTNAISDVRGYRRDNLLRVKRNINGVEDITGTRFSAADARQFGVPLSNNDIRYIDTVQAQQRGIDESRLVNGTMAIEAPTQTQVIAVVHDGDVADSSKSNPQIEYFD